MLTVSASKRQKAKDRMAAAVREYADLGWPCCPGAHSMTDGTRACSCDRIGCPSPGAHPRSQVWKKQATDDAEVLARWWADSPNANIILPTGRVFDVFDVPAKAGVAALERIERVRLGPVASLADERYLFFVATRGAPADEDEWWSCQLDCVPESVEDTPGMRWHCRDSYVVAPPSTLAYGREVSWVNPPTSATLPDPMRLLEILADACE